MRMIALLSIAAAALTTAAIGWGFGPAGSRNAASDRGRALAAVSSQAASGTIEAFTPPSMATAALRYRADACGGDYVCGADGPWEPVVAAPAEIRPSTSDGF